MFDVIIDDEEVDTDEEKDLCDLCGEEEDVCECVTCTHCGDKSSDMNLCSICEDSHGSCCNCCSDCGLTECQCCEECGCIECECNSDSFGDSSRPAWETRGIKPESAASNATSNWQMIWPEIDATNFDVCQQAADFYLLEAITNGLVNSDKCFLSGSPAASVEQLLFLIGADDDRIIAQLEAKRIPDTNIDDKNPTALERTLASVMKDAQVLYTRRVDKADEILRAYFHMACAGEARHHQALKGRVLSHDRDRAWSGWRSIYDQIGPEALLDLAALFYEFEGGAYGGTPWANACEILHSREMGTLGPNPEMNKKMFIDRAWTLEHNGGCFLNKISWGIKNNAGWTMGDLKDKVLNSHAANPIRWRLLLKAASKEVKTLFDQCWEINNELNGTTNDNPRIVVGPTRRICYGCNSNPLIGHFRGCNRQDFQTIDEDEFCGRSWTVWRETGYNAFYDKDMNILHPEVPMQVTFRPYVSVLVEPKDDNVATNAYNRNLTFQWKGFDNSILHMELPVGEISSFVFDPTHWLNAIKTEVRTGALNYWNENNSYGMTEALEEKDMRFIFTNASFQIRHALSTDTFFIADPYRESKKKNKYTLKTGA